MVVVAAAAAVVVVSFVEDCWLSCVVGGCGRCGRRVSSSFSGSSFFCWGGGGSNGLSILSVFSSVFFYVSPSHEKTDGQHHCSIISGIKYRTASVTSMMFQSRGLAIMVRVLVVLKVLLQMLHATSRMHAENCPDVQDAKDRSTRIAVMKSSKR